MGLIGFALLVGFLAGPLPCFCAQWYSPVIVMKGNFSAGSTKERGFAMDSSISIYHFHCSYRGYDCSGKQMKYMQSKRPGFR